MEPQRTRSIARPTLARVLRIAHERPQCCRRVGDLVRERSDITVAPFSARTALEVGRTSERELSSETSPDEGVHSARIGLQVKSQPPEHRALAGREGWDERVHADAGHRLDLFSLPLVDGHGQVGRRGLVQPLLSESGQNCGRCAHAQARLGWRRSRCRRNASLPDLSMKTKIYGVRLGERRQPTHAVERSRSVPAGSSVRTAAGSMSIASS